MRSALMLAAWPLLASAIPNTKRQTATKTLIPTTSFTEFDTYWDDLYPWGTDHNGGARMNESQVSVSDGVLTLTATPVSGQPPATNGGVEYQIHYLSGAIHAKQTFAVAKGGGFDFTGEFKATTTKGTWPAFWLTAVSGWPPEIDMAEWKGSGDISFNTFNTSSNVAAHDVAYPNPDEWHTIKAELRDEDGSTVRVKFYMDGVEQTTQYGENYINAGLYLIINLQMEGSSGSPGPNSNVEYSVRNLEVVSYQ
ncbi:concanavalin A-like lectin/glucanase domain-containing protein [Biscogniauxia mediterranea]|nr:concanavalin A-like lectin/glucanase domain-containing protein [Biscogniauxia mediterranea]